MAFTKWCYDTHRIREPLRGVSGFNAKEDRRHDRRTLSLADLRRLIDAAQRGACFEKMTGSARALCYRLAVATGLRYSEIASITPQSFAWNARPVTVCVPAAYTKNGQTATLPLPDDLVRDLADHARATTQEEPLFPLPFEKGAEMLRTDLEAAGIPYCDGSGQFLDFHSLRCQTATLADAAGVSPRVVQKLMRHSSLELTGRYTRPRVVDIENATASLPSLSPSTPDAQSLAATGTENATHKTPLAPYLRPGRVGTERFEAVTGDFANLVPLSPKCSNLLIDQGFEGNLMNTGDGTRTHDLRIMRPPLENRKYHQTQDLRQATLSQTAQGQRPESNDPDLAAVIDAWDTLPEAVRASILMLVEAASNKNSA